MSALGGTSKIAGVLNRSLDAGPVKMLNPVKTDRGHKNFYCPNCYGMNLAYRQVETGVFDISCLDCHKHWTKIKKSEKMQKLCQKTLDKGEIL